MNKPHKHAQLMLQYAQDAQETETPWERWEYKYEDEKWKDSDGPLHFYSDFQYRRKPWTLGRSVNGFTLGEGQEWHRNDWTEDMLPDGWRPHILGERNEGEDYYFYDGRWHSMQQTLAKTTSYDLHIRTRRPLPPVIDQYAELKAEFKAGKQIQLLCANGEWINVCPDWSASVDKYRIKPAPKLVPLGPEDVPPGSVIRSTKSVAPKSWISVLNVISIGVEIAGNDGITMLSFSRLEEECWQISRDNGKTWERCEKEAK